MDKNILDEEFEERNYQEGLIQYASFWRRVAATLIDSLVMIPVVGILTLNNLDWKILLLSLLCWAIVTLYKPYMEFNYAATLGKMAMGIQVISQDHEPVSARQALERYVPWLPNQILSLWAMVSLFNMPGFQEATSLAEVTILQQQSGVSEQSVTMGLLMLVACIFVAFDSENRGLHDMMAGTYVVHKTEYR